MSSHKPSLRVSVAAAGLVFTASLLPVLLLTPAHAQTTTVRMVNTAFNPSTVRIPVGGTVTWVNQDTVPHTATDDHNAWTSPLLNKGDSYSHTFDQAGTVTYYCVVHPGQMKGTIIIGGAATATAPPTAPAQTTVTPGTAGTVTPTPVPSVAPHPTATPTLPTYPAAGQLYNRSVQALKSARGYRIAESAAQTSSGRKLTFTLRGDVSGAAKEERLSLRVTTNGRKTIRTEIIQIKTSAWIKRASIDRTWKKVTASRLNSLLNPLRNPLTQRSGVTVSQLKTVGPALYQGVPVWHVRWRETSGALSGTVDTLIARNGFLPYRTVRSLDSRSTRAHVSDRITRTRLGEPVQIKAPVR